MPDRDDTFINTPFCGFVGQVFSDDKSVVAHSLQDMAEHEPGPKRQRLQETRDLVKEVAEGQITNKTLEHALVQHVDSIDADLVCTEKHLADVSLTWYNPD